MKTLSFEIISIVWGSAYVDLFLDVIIPNYLSANNLPACTREYDISWKIYTTVEDHATILKHPHYVAASKLLNIQILDYVSQKLTLDPMKKYDVKGLCQSHAIKNGIANNKVLLLLNPDSMIADGGMSKCCQLIEEGNRVVLVFELARASIESIVPEILSTYYDANQMTINLSNRKLVQLGIHHLLSFTKSAIWEEPGSSSWPSFMYWRAGKNSLLGKSLHFHPISLDCRNIQKECPDVLMPDDGGLIEFLNIHPKSIYVVQSTDELACVELSRSDTIPIDIFQYGPLRSLLYFIQWTLKYTLPSQRGNFRHYNVLFQADEEINWKAIESKVRKITYFPNLVFLITLPFSRQSIGSLLKKLGLFNFIKKLITSN